MNLERTTTAFIRGACRPRLALAVTLLAVGLWVFGGPAAPPGPPEPAHAAGAGGAGTSAARAAALRPNPARANVTDKGELWDDGCVVLGDDTTSPPCVYGNPRSDKKVVVLGDSHGLEWFPPLLELAKRRDWRLVGLVKANCVVAQIAYERACNVWRRKTMRRIVRRERPDMVVVSSSTNRYPSRILHNGRKPGPRASLSLLSSGFAKILRRLKQTGAKVVLIRDQSLAPQLPPKCVMRNPGNPNGACAFPSRRKIGRAFDFFGARRARVPIIDPDPKLCPRGTCPVVVGNLLVYRDVYHTTATFARTLTPWLARRLPLPLG